VRDQHDGGAELADGALEPLHRVEIEVVGGLVEQQHVGPRHQRAGQRRARQLPAREATQRARELLLADAEAAQHPLEPGAPGVAAGALQLRVRLLVGGQHLGPGVAAGHARLEVGEVALGLLGARHALGDVLLERELGRQGRALVVQRHLRALRQADRAAVGLELPGQDPQQGGLALAVAPDHGQALARVDAEADIRQDIARSEGLADLNRLHDRLG
jgi:hypothetical protein